MDACTAGGCVQAAGDIPAVDERVRARVLCAHGCDGPRAAHPPGRLAGLPPVQLRVHVALGQVEARARHARAQQSEVFISWTSL